ncbi:hypothetical protein TNCV_3194271 [Trichonephila clavipes]|uniref:Uncharacterized protein n=1 Tax=Trichonephila clavipes TaxID=2585209 RepID=A0A8X6REA3_TRICX|nr:hypothetical protein TNCV_3194271 [Trichonephila clavipes]
MCEESGPVRGKCQLRTMRWSNSRFMVVHRSFDMWLQERPGPYWTLSRKSKWYLRFRGLRESCASSCSFQAEIDIKRVMCRRFKETDWKVTRDTSEKV